MNNFSDLQKQAAAGQSLPLRALHLFNKSRRGAAALKGNIAKLSAGGIATGASVGYFTGGLEGTRKSQMDAYKSGKNDGMNLTKTAGAGSQLLKIVKNKLTPKTMPSKLGVAKFLGTAALAGGVSHMVTGGVERRLNNTIGNYGGINKMKNGEQ